jgi:deoxyadenosine/deoxycytidine kinase/NTP pyrophosphatase (non-canonical NTP hydrolase)
LSQETISRSRYIIVEGPIGVGKTTLARMLREHLDTALLLEVFEENPFLSKFYESRAQYAFQTQMFFLLSRYRQQQNVSNVLLKKSLISDYMFAKDWLFAQLNLAGDEWEVYRQIHDALAERIATPDLVLYLKADTDVLMGRIAQRDRTYERDMDRDYIEALRQAYEHFFADYHQSPWLAIDTNSLNFVRNAEDLHTIMGQIKSVLHEGIVQPRLPHFEGTVQRELSAEQRYSLPAYQQFHVEMDRAKGFITDLYFNYLCLSEEMGELGSELAQLWREEAELLIQGQPSAKAKEMALQKRKTSLESEMADCMAYLLKLANYANIDLEAAYQVKMSLNQTRTWR